MSTGRKPTYEKGCTKMKKRNFARAVPSLALFAAFALWTAAVCRVDVRAIGPGGSSVGFAAMNGWVHGLTGVHMALYTLTDWLDLVPLCFVLGLINCCAEFKKQSLTRS